MLLRSAFENGLTMEGFMLSALVSLGLGLLTALVYMYRNHYTASMVMTLVVLPLTVQTVIFLVNGNLGVGVAVAGAFSLVRFRSIPGSAKEISALFMAMAIGLATATGYLLVALIFALFSSICLLVMTRFSFGQQQVLNQELKITVPEALDFEQLFEEVLNDYTKTHELTLVRTTNLGSLYELTYNVQLRPGIQSKDFLDALRVLNGNLGIRLMRGVNTKEEL